MSAPAQDQAQARSRPKMRRAAAAGMAGTMLEYYDFAIYGLAAALVFGPVFFPSTDPAVGVLASFATFGVGFLARPLGGIVFGHLGDRMGRKNILVVTVLMMGLSTVLIGCLPGYDSIGYWGAALLVALRLVQGFAFGGEQSGAILMVAEHAGEGRRGLFSALPGAGLSLGLILGNLAFLAVGQLGQEALLAWGWRIPFWAGGVLVIVGLLIRRTVAESPEFERLKASRQVSRSPILELVRTHPVEILFAVGVQVGVAVTAYIAIAYSLSFAKLQGVPGSLPLIGVLVASALHLVLLPLAGGLSDRIGRLPVHATGVLVLAVMGVLFLPMIAGGTPGLVIGAYVLFYGLGWGVLTGAFPSMLAESFDPAVSYSGLSVAMQLGNIVGGFTPFVATLVVTAWGTGALGIGVTVIVLLSGVSAAALVRRTARRRPGGTAGTGARSVPGAVAAGAEGAR
ncbi:MFS transporter [Pseudonocardia broussonetiae]|uniref:MHS family MFS transporter n=1 Tax=Pseudonocardia broussonetiae TaxID=2736640 RepID=A0A6M6JPJ9_9PSEU|nr:MFS transporter [Pseudonocardia broussonetiae]QJY48867.1 MHS family MFS transporter [Pseudonocardia broussonetiae]